MKERKEKKKPKWKTVEILNFSMGFDKPKAFPVGCIRVSRSQEIHLHTKQNKAQLPCIHSVQNLYGDLTCFDHYFDESFSLKLQRQRRLSDSNPFTHKGNENFLFFKRQRSTYIIIPSDLEMSKQRLGEWRLMVRKHEK